MTCSSAMRPNFSRRSPTSTYLTSKTPQTITSHSRTTAWTVIIGSLEHTGQRLAPNDRVDVPRHRKPNRLRRNRRQSERTERWLDLARTDVEFLVRHLQTVDPVVLYYSYYLVAALDSCYRPVLAIYVHIYTRAKLTQCTPIVGLLFCHFCYTVKL